MNLPNKLTIVRILLTPVYLLLFCTESVPYNYIFALLVFVVAAVTDALDGRIARKNNIVTNLGKIADPIADKILTTAVFLCFMKINLCSIWIVIIILAREFTVSAIRITSASQGVVVPANIYGKIKTVLQMVVSILVMLALSVEQLIGISIPYFETVTAIMLGITAFITIFSGAVYIKDSMKVIDFSE